MKKIYLIFLLLFAGSVAKAQYFQHLYGDPYPNDFQYVSGVNTTNILYGHLMGSSYRDPGSPLPFGAQVTFTDENGTPIFNNVYSISTWGTDGGGFYRNLVFEWDHAPNIGVVGITDDIGGETVYYMQLDQTGNVLGIFGYNLSLLTANNWHVRGMYKLTESVDGNYIYVMGQALGPNAVNQDADFFVLKIEVATGNLIWSNLYDFGYSSPGGGSMDIPYDLIESPYLIGGGTELIVVGQYWDNLSPAMFNSYGFVYKVDANTGNPLGNVELFRSVGGVNDNLFTSITVANSPAMGNPGFVIAGNADNRMWSIKTDPLGTVLWQNSYSSAAQNSDEAYDVIERFNPYTNRYEYYYGGFNRASGTGDFDIIVIKTDEFGNVVANGQFMYDWLERSVCRELDQFNDAGPNKLNGLSIYAYTYGAYYGTSQLMHIKTYFNGFMECNDWRDTPLQFPGAGPVGNTTASIVGDMMTGFWAPPTVVNVRAVGDQNICFNMSVPGGSNARVAPSEPKGDEQQTTISPNPMTQGVQYANVNVDAEQAEAAQVSIYDMLGRTYFSQNFVLVKGENNLLLDISKTNMAAGMYTVRIESQSTNKSIVLLVK